MTDVADGDGRGLFSDGRVTDGHVFLTDGDDSGAAGQVGDSRVGQDDDLPLQSGGESRNFYECGHGIVEAGDPPALGH